MRGREFKSTIWCLGGFRVWKELLVFWTIALCKSVEPYLQVTGCGVGGVGGGLGGKRKQGDFPKATVKMIPNYSKLENNVARLLIQSFLQ